jgi:hypothetical protein
MRRKFIYPSLILPGLPVPSLLRINNPCDIKAIHLTEFENQDSSKLSEDSLACTK